MGHGIPRNPGRRRLVHEPPGEYPLILIHLFFQVANAEEYIDGVNTGSLGEILIRCNNVLWISGAEED
jgi:small nuclear ribonucleoprotein F